MLLRNVNGAILMRSSAKPLFGFFTYVLSAAALAVISISTALAQTETQEDEELQIVAERFGIRSSVLDISLSPSGTKIAWIAPGPNHTEILNVFDLNGDTGVQRIASNTEMIADMRECDWATEDRLLCEVYGMTRSGDGVLLPFTRMFAINGDGTDPKGVSRSRTTRQMRFNQDGGDVVALDVAGAEGSVLVTRNYIEENSMGTRLASTAEGLGVDRLDIVSGRTRSEERPDPNASFYLADENGSLRLKVRSLTDSRGFLTGERVFMVRDPGESRWQRLNDITLDGNPLSEFSPAAVDAQNNVLYAYLSLSGFRSVIEVPLDGSTEARIVASRDDVDVANLIRIGRQRRVVGVSFAAEKRVVQYLDEELAELASSLGEALPNQPLISIVSASSDENRLLIIASSDTDAGTVYLYDKGTRNLEVLLAMRDALVGQPMGQMRPISYPATDGTEIPGYLTLPPESDGQNLPAIVLPHGGPAARDYWGFDWLVQFFTARGYAVFQPNYRGSSGYGEAWFGRNGYQAWDVAIGDVNDAGRWMVSEGIADPYKLAVVGWSYGGYAALLSQVVDPELYKAVVAIAPVTDLELLRDEARAYTSFRFRDRQLGRGAHIAAGSPQRHADRFIAPVALFHGTRDANVSVRHSRVMADALEDEGKVVTYVEFEDLQHGLHDSNVRVEMLKEIDRFLASALSR